ncbi:MAG: hypothetical protein GKR86_03975 [Ilumatobacter sp.]|nr:hypothetical protein [bacterium]NKB40206.1 hypothetical protein [Ilumatobacter sp.]
MKTRTLLLLSVGTALMILLAGGALLFQLSGQKTTSEATPLGEEAAVGDARVVVLDSELLGDRLIVAMEIGGVDDTDGIDSFRLVTGDRQLSALGPAEGDRCDGITEVRTRCLIEFDVGEVDGTSRVLIMRRGEQQATWRLT